MVLQLRRTLPLSAQLIGVDGGASEVKVHEVLVVEDELGRRLKLGERAASRVYPRVPSFTPPSARGIERGEDLGAIDAAEREQAWAWIESTAQCIARVARDRGAKSVLIGIAMPGQKSRDGRSIQFAFNGPRIPEFLDRLEEQLDDAGVVLLAPLIPLLSDGLCCGLGEEHAESGLLRDVDDAYYVGGGTGLAEALKVRGKLVETEDFQGAFPKAWALSDRAGRSFDVSLSAAGINRRFAERARLALPLEPGQFPEQRVEVDSAAQTVFEDAASCLAQLLVRRLCTLGDLPKAVPDAAQPFALERFVVGQRLGRLLDDARTRPWFLVPFRRELLAELRSAELMQDRYRELERELSRSSRPRKSDANDFVRVSHLRAAPAIGAAATALIAWGNASA
jgi:predicted NBD/HSP70 family sugar kinase